jgi:hypothetical protein
VLDFVADFTSVKDYSENAKINYTENAKITPPQSSCFVFCNGRGDPYNSLGPIPNHMTASIIFVMHLITPRKVTIKNINR